MTTLTHRKLSSKDCRNSRSSHRPSNSPRQPNASSDLESMRRKLQRETIENDSERIQLWSAALKLVFYSRIILSKPRRKDQLDQSSVLDSYATIPSTNGIMTNNAEELESRLRHINLAGEISLSPDKTKDWSTARTGSELLDLGRLRFNNTTAAEARAHGTRNVTLNKHMHDSGNISSIDGSGCQQMFNSCLDNIMELVIRMAADPNSVLDEEQIRNAIDYGTNYQTLAKEIDHRAKSDAFQIWCVLERIGCLQYHM